MMPFEPIAAHHFLRDLARHLPRPQAILMISAHWETDQPVSSTAPRPETIYDFYGFPPELYDLTYPAPGAPELARRAADLTGGTTDSARGLDHGAWVPLLLAWPQADIPVTQLSIQPHLGPAHQYRLGEALRPLRDEGVLIIASGGISHNLRAWLSVPPGTAPQKPMTEFAGWMADKIIARDDAAIIGYRDLAPHAAFNHPRDEHFQPLHVALGAATPGVPGELLHRSVNDRGVPMDAYLFH
jgi:4,5-DOPA dioxygenase extradiol